MEVIDIDPAKLYSVREAAALVPSARGGHVCTRTLHQWRKAKILPMLARQRGTRTFWLVRGSDLIKALGTDANTPPEGPAPESKAQRAESEARALRTLRALGFEL